MGLGVAEDGDCSLVDGGEVYEEHVESAAPVIGLLWCALRCDVLGSGAEDRGGYVCVCVPLSKGVVYLARGGGDWKV